MFEYHIINLLAAGYTLCEVKDCIWNINCYMWQLLCAMSIFMVKFFWWEYGHQHSTGHVAAMMYLKVNMVDNRSCETWYECEQLVLLVPFYSMQISLVPSCQLRPAWQAGEGKFNAVLVAVNISCRTVIGKCSKASCTWPRYLLVSFEECH